MNILYANLLCVCVFFFVFCFLNIYIYINIGYMYLYPACCEICEFLCQFLLGSPQTVGQKISTGKDVSLRLGNSSLFIFISIKL